MLVSLQTTMPTRRQIGFCDRKTVRRTKPAQLGQPETTKTLGALAAHIETVLQRKPVVINPNAKSDGLHGAAAGRRGFSDGNRRGVDLYLTGKFPKPNTTLPMKRVRLSFRRASRDGTLRRTRWQNRRQRFSGWKCAILTKTIRRGLEKYVTLPYFK